ncbi:hypothetical protein BDW74DRAFT_150631 [Aspergillus multicolor]|uniref:uncharacterized protein n=1 Tax=Aspergillus multicolor TaxID=41759 RepID=UPI003CCE1697
MTSITIPTAKAASVATFVVASVARVLVTGLSVLFIIGILWVYVANPLGVFAADVVRLLVAVVLGILDFEIIVASTAKASASISTINLPVARVFLALAEIFSTGIFLIIRTFLTGISMAATTTMATLSVCTCSVACMSFTTLALTLTLAFALASALTSALALASTLAPTSELPLLLVLTFVMRSAALAMSGPTGLALPMRAWTCILDSLLVPSVATPSLAVPVSRSLLSLVSACTRALT